MATIYLSSTYEDLKDYRRVVFEALRKSGHDMIAMEDYVATDQRPVAKCLDDVAKLIRRHLPNVLTYLQHGITNARLEVVNATIQWVKNTARGFRNVEHFKTAIYFHCGGPDLYPTHTKA